MIPVLCTSGHGLYVHLIVSGSLLPDRTVLARRTQVWVRVVLSGTKRGQLQLIRLIILIWLALRFYMYLSTITMKSMQFYNMQ